MIALATMAKLKCTLEELILALQVGGKLMTD